MGSTRVTYAFLVVLFGWSALAGTTQAQQGDSSEERAIRALIERINLAMSADTADKGVAIMRSVISDKGYAIVQANPEGGSEAFVGDKKALCEWVGQSLRDGPKWGVHKVHKITIAGPLAYEVGETIQPNQDAKAGGNTLWLNVFAKEDVGWRLVYGTPADGIQKAFRQLDARKGKPAK